VIRDFARSALGSKRMAELNGVLLAAAAADLPVATSPGDQDDGGSVVAWWKLGTGEGYLRSHLI
jgi:hypothetical protein